MLKKILNIYNDFLINLFKIKWFCVDYNKFLRKQKNSGFLSNEERKKRCKKLVFLSCFFTVTITFLATIPTDVKISIPLACLDFLQFQIFLNLIQQQIMYIYGAKDLRTDGIIERENGLYLMWLQSVTMFGLHGSMTSKLKSAGSFVLRKSITLIFTKSPFRAVLMTFIRQFLKWAGVVVTHELVLSSLDILVTGLCAMIAASVSLWQFYPMCKNFIKNINNQGITYYENEYVAE